LNTATKRGVLVVFTAWLGNFKVFGVTLTAGTPTPLNGAVCGLLEELSLTAKVPVSAARRVGVNVTKIWHFVPADNVFGAIGHVEVSAKSPDTEILLMVRGVA
jgi:hypothetical protein